ncbi:MAG: UDP-3-O-(3-hydroxymyristoyl)glucosamine N-acyltransferase [Muribaculaceae bacterium]|nr:UDP-3-O-(3-hydroxymyristoyl)glucosamine N-acyltransferase [Muribaculaceae bacterium]
MEFTAIQIATLVNGIVEGDNNATVNTFAKIEEGHPGAISFLANPKYTNHIYNTESSIVLVKKDFSPERPIKTTLIKVDDPYATLAMLLDMVNQLMNPQPIGIEEPSFISTGVEIPEGAYVGAFTYIGKGVKLGKEVKIYPQVYIGNNVEIGDNTIIYPGVKIYHGCKIGDRCILQAGVVVGGDGFGFAPVSSGYNKIPQIGNVEIGNDVEIGANTTIDRATMGSTRIKNGVKLDNLIQVAHNVEIGSNTVMAAQVGIAGSTKIGENCMVGGQVGFAGHITIGNNVMIGAQTGIPSNIADNSRIMGSPATDIKDFARQVVYIKNLGKLNSKITEIEKKLNK